MLSTSPHARLVGLVDLDVDRAAAVAKELAPETLVGAELTDVAQSSGAGAVINVTVPAAHRIVNEHALRLGLPVLCEKPLAPSLSDALRQVALADLTGQTLMVSQSRRYFNHLAALRVAVERLGALAAVTQEFFHEDHEPGFREQMEHPLLVDMSIHHFDALRFATGDEPVSVQCHTWNPPWSWYRGDACATADFELRSGAHFLYSGSRCTPGLSTSWNASWRVQGERGAATWDGDAPLAVDAKGVDPVSIPGNDEGLAGALGEFVHAVRTGTGPQCDARANVLSLAMVEAAIASSAMSGQRVVIADLLEQAYEQALREETAVDVLAQLRAWGTAHIGITQDHKTPAAPAATQEEEQA
jgi:predicted dehydrogenase